MMAETWINYWYLEKDGKLVKTERLPKRDSLYVYERAERPSKQISLHTFYCPHTGETRKFDAACDKDRILKRPEIVRELLTITGVNIMRVIRLAGLWKKKDKQGNFLLRGDLNEISRVVVMKNTSKNGDKDPDYFLYIGAKSKKAKEDKSSH